MKHNYSPWLKGLALAGSSAYKFFTSSGQSSEPRLSRVPQKYQALSSKMASYSNSKRYKKSLFKKGKTKNRLRKRLSIKKKKMKKFGKYLDKVDMFTQPYSIYYQNYSQSLIPSTDLNAGDSRFGNTKIYGDDIGLCRFAASTTGNWTGVIDDIAQGIILGTNNTINTTGLADDYNNMMLIDDLSHKICLRNNSNIGVRIKVYYVSRKKSYATASNNDSDCLIIPQLLAAMDESYNPPYTTKIRDTFMNYQATLFDYPTVCARFNIKKSKEFILYPAQTQFFKLKCPISGRPFNVANASNRTADPRYHRAIVFQLTGLPVHSSDTENMAAGPVAYGAYNVDMLVSKRLKYRLVKEINNENTHGFSNSTLTAIPLAKQEIQPAVNPSNVTLAS